MRLYERENSPYWWYEFTVPGRRGQIRGSTRRPLSDKSGAKRVMAAEYEKECNRLQFGEKPDITIREAMQRTVDTVEGSTRVSYDLSMRRLLGDGEFASRWHLDGDRALSSLSYEDLEDFVRARKREGLKDNSILVEIRFIKRVNNLMAKRFLTNRDIEYPKVEMFQKTRYLTPQEESAVLSKLDEHRGSPAYDKAKELFVILLDTGMRLNEALTLDWADVDLSAGVIIIYREKTKIESMVPITNRVDDILRRRHNQRAPFEGMTRAVKVLRKAIDAECNGNRRIVAQRGKATIHSLRDTFASRLAKQGMSLKKLALLLGHTSTRMTEKYSHLENSDVVEEARRLMAS